MGRKASMKQITFTGLILSVCTTRLTGGCDVSRLPSSSSDQFASSAYLVCGLLEYSLIEKLRSILSHFLH